MDWTGNLSTIAVHFVKNTTSGQIQDSTACKGFSINLSTAYYFANFTCLTKAYQLGSITEWR